jgi:tetratricopeptide (TPR) repeat protein
MLTGELPFAGRSDTETMMKRMVETCPDPRTINPSIPAKLALIVTKMADKKIGARYQTPGELLRDLESFAHPRSFKSRFAAIAATFLITMMAAWGYNYLRHGNYPANYQAIDRYLSERNYVDLNKIIAEQLEQTPDDSNLIYAQGICSLEQHDDEATAKIIARLQSLPDGQNKAYHLQILQNIRRQNFEAALRDIETWLSKSPQKLPFLSSQGVILEAQGNQEAAKNSLMSALNEAAFLNYQKLEVFDRLASLFAKENNFAQARELYQRALDKNARLPRSQNLLANYSAALLRSGDAAAALPVVEEMLSKNPDDDYSRYLHTRIQEVAGQKRDNDIAAIMKTIDEVNTFIQNNPRETDRWSSAPLILTVLPITLSGTTSRIGLEDYLSDRLTESLRSTINFPLVDRDSLEHILREHQLNASTLGSKELQLQVGKLMPASILIDTSYQESGDSSIINLKLIDVETSEVIAMIKQEGSSGQIPELITALTEKTEKTILKDRSVQGRIMEVDSGYIIVNLGSYHGVTEKQSVKIYPAGKTVSPRMLASRPPYATATIETGDKFSSQITLTPAAAGEKPLEITPNMLVIYQ